MILRHLLLVIERDIRLIFEYKMFLVLRWLWYFMQVIIFGLAISLLVTVENYFYYYAAGIYVATLYSTAIFVAYDIAEEADHGVVDYLLSLPINRRILMVGRAVGGGLRSIIATVPPLIFTLILVGVRDPFILVGAIISLFLLSFGIAGLGITIVSILKSGDKTDILLGAIDAFIIRLSTVFYPRAFMPPVYSSLAAVNPLTHASELFRWGLGIPVHGDPIFSLVILIAFMLSMTSVGVYLYEKRMEGGGWT
jgi:ABC-2 type transport system permease protein